MLPHEENPLHEVPGSDVKLTNGQLAAYNAAFQTIEGKRHAEHLYRLKS